MTAAEFIADFPEFTGASSTLIDSKLAQAERETDTTIFTGDNRTDAVKYLAAHMMACSPFARDMKLVNKDGESDYSKTRRRIERLYCGGPYVSATTADE